MRYVLVIVFAALAQSFCALGQQDIAIGEWQAYLSYNEHFDVTQSTSYVYAATERALLKIDKSDLAVEKFTKVEGLSDTEPRRIIFDPTSQSLLIGYANGNIDLMDAEGVFNMPNIFNNSNIQVSKFPNHARIDDTGHGYVAFNFGLVQINLAAKTFGFSLLTEFEIYDFVKLENRFYFSSENGIYWADANPSINHADLSVWTKLEDGWPDQYFSVSIAAFNGKIYCDLDGDLTRIENDEPVLIQEAEEDYFIRNISVVREHLAVSYEFKGGGFQIDQLFFLDSDEQLAATYDRSFCSIVVYSVIEDEAGRVYYANGSSLKYLEEIGGGCQEITALGPPNTDAYEIAFRNNEVLVVAGELRESGVVAFNTHGLYRYKDQVWDQFNHADGFFGDSVKSYTDVVVGPNQEIAIGTFFKGLIKISPDGQEVELLDEHNSCLEEHRLLNLTSVTGIQYDSRGTLWMSNYNAPRPIKAIDADGNCYSFSLNSSLDQSSLTELTIDDRGFKWFTTFDAGVGIIVFDEGDIDDPSDDRFRGISASNSVLTDNVVWDIVTDLDGDVWAGTETGVVVFECGASIFDNGCNGRRPIVEVEGVPALLLENERVRAVAVDGANRKWFGTNNGIFVQSPNGEEEVLHFNEQNSPLISNFIRDIQINPLTGEVFIATIKGLMSYRTDATLGDESVHAPESDVFAFPNPVRPEYDGPIAIKGLPRDARVKITDIQGKLIFQGEANGGEAIWNGRDYNGRKASSGVYLVFSTSQSAFEKPDALVSKILIVK